MFDAVKWGEVFLPGVPVLEILVRGTVMSLLIFVLLRVTQQRQAGGLSVTDVLVVVLIADAAGPALSGGEASSILDGALLVATIMFWSFALNWLASQLPVIDRFVHPPPLPLVRDGRLLPRNMRRELVTREELLTQLREPSRAWRTSAT
ncbi:hypothetical protein V3W47_04325 [Deinococcus sp. YIM 134068]|uniref:DUF421 domain-containing protein n=1 Tax=Deinococcus lichenicola TaxID=3118910 RepID=UPI002F93B0BF